MPHWRLSVLHECSINAMKYAHYSSGGNPDNTKGAFSIVYLGIGATLAQ